MEHNHRRKARKRHRAPNSTWSSSKAFRKSTEIKYRALVRSMMHDEEYDIIPNEVKARNSLEWETAWY